MATNKFKIENLNEISGLLSSDRLLIERTIDDITSANYITPYDMLSHLHFDAYRTSTDKSARTQLCLCFNDEVHGPMLISQTELSDGILNDARYDKSTRQLVLIFDKKHRTTDISVSLSDMIEIDGISTMVEVTYDELVDSRNSGTLIPGAKYRITDYVATVSNDVSAKSAYDDDKDVGFDIIVTADSANELNESAHAIRHSGNDYYPETTKFEAWKVNYCIDNDTNRFAWADAENGKGVVYRLIDEFGNDCPYDFKGIQFQAYGNRDEVWRWTFDSGTSRNNTDYSLSGTTNGIYNNVIGAFVYQVSETQRLYKLNHIVFKGVKCYSNSFGNNCNNNTFNPRCDNNTFGNNCHSNIFGYYCNNNTFGNKCLSNTFGDSCYSNAFGDNSQSNIFGNSCNSNAFGDNSYSNTFGYWCYCNTFGNNCGVNTFGDHCNDNAFSNDCSANTFGDNCWNNTFGNSCLSNTLNNNCYSNTFGDNCISNAFGISCYGNVFGNDCDFNAVGSYYNFNTFGNHCLSNTFAGRCDNNAFGNNCLSNTFGYGCRSNIFGNYCSNNIFGNTVNSSFCRDNIFGNNCEGNTFGDSCSHNIFDNNCLGNIFGDSCYSNTFGNYCQGNRFDNNCVGNTFGTECRSNRFYNDCYSNTFDISCSSNTLNDGCVGNTFGNICKYNVFGNSCDNNKFDNYCATNIFGDSCRYNKFSNNCNSNRFGNNCDGNEFGNNCNTNKFGDYCSSNTFGGICQNIYFSSQDSIDAGVFKSYYRYINIASGNCNLILDAQNAAESRWYQNIEIKPGVNNSSSTRVIRDINVNQHYTTTYKAHSSQEIEL